MFVGYPFGKKRWKLFDLDSQDFFVSRDVKFFEYTFPYILPRFSDHPPSSTLPSPTTMDYDFYELEDD